MKSLLKAAIFVIVLGGGIWYLTKLKAERVGMDEPHGSDWKARGSVWKYGTSDLRLQEAIEANDTGEVRRLLKSVPTAVIRPYAAEMVARSYPGCLVTFLEAGWSPDGARRDGTILFQAIESHDPLMVKILLDHGANPNLPNPLYGWIHGKSAIFTAAFMGKGVEVCRMLLQHKADSTDAPLGDDYEVTKLLLEHGCDPNRRPFLLNPARFEFHGDNPGWRQNPVSMTRLLLDHGAKPDVVGFGARTLDKPNENIKGTALFFHAAHGQADCVRLLLAHGADPTKKSSSGQTPLDVATGECRELISSAIRSRGKDKPSAMGGASP